MPNCIKVEIPEQDKSYPIFMDSEPIENLKDKVLKTLPDNKFLVIISEKVHKLYHKTLDFDKKNLYILKDGETQKNFKNYQKLLKQAQTMKLNRKSTIIAIGGGVVGDIAGFVAATYMRGINFIQISTTLLACVDSSVGGKVAVDTEYGKNIVGAFYQPKSVFINLNFLNTLDNRQFKSGLAEVLKYSFIEKSCETLYEYGLFDFLNIHYEKILNRDLRFLEKIIKVCIELKISVVTKDEKEESLRKILNFGHTYGHALEKLTGYKKLTHGEAVVYGMFLMINYAHKIKLIDANYKELALGLLAKYGYTDKKFCLNTKKIIETMKSDKKAESDKIKIIVPTSKGYVKEDDFNPEIVFNEKLF